MAGRIRGVLQIRDFRWLWWSLAASSLGDWLGLLARTAMATELASGYTAANFALGGVLVAQLIPAVLLGPIAGVFADRFDRRHVMIFCDVLRFAIFASIPLVGTLTWLFAASFLIECFGVFWRPAKEASVPNLLQRKDQLEPANQLSLITTYGVTPVLAAILFAVLAWATRTLGLVVGFFQANQVDLAMYLNALTFAFAAYTVLRITSISGPRIGVTERPPSLARQIREGLAFVRGTPLVRGLVTGILGAFAAGGTVIGTGRIYAASLGGGNAAYGILFGALFVGLGTGMAAGPRIAPDLSRQRLFGLSIITSAVFLAILSVMPHLVFAAIAIVAVGFFAGVAYLAGMTLLGGEVDDEIRGRTFAFVQSMVQVVLIATLATVPFLVGLLRQHSYRLGHLHGVIDGSRFLLFAGGTIGVVVGILSYRQLDDRRSVSLVADFVSAVRGDSTARRQLASGGIFVAFEGGEGTGKTTQLTRLAATLRGAGRDVVETREPGGTDVGARIREILLAGPADPVSPRAEALLFAADRADHVAAVIRPALDAGRVVLTDRYVDSSLAYQGAGRVLPVEDIRRLSRWATDDLRPDLTVILDLDPAIGLQRAGRRSAADRMEAESLQFHQRIREGFRHLVEANPTRYAVIDAAADADTVAAQVLALVEPLFASPRDGAAERPGGAGAPPAGDLPVSDPASGLPGPAR